MFGLKKAIYRFDLDASDNIQLKTISDATSLTSYVIGVNNDLFAKDTKGWLLIEKSKVTKKGDQKLYGLKLDLPILEENSYFDELLFPFHTKKPIEYDQSVFLVDKNEIELEAIDNEEPVMTEEMKHLVEKGSTKITPSVETADFDEEENINEESTEEIEQENVEELLRKLKQQEEEIQKLKTDKQPMETNDPVENTDIEVAKERIVSETLTDTAKLPENITTTDTEDQSISEVLDMVKVEFGSRLELLIKKEKEKIQEEIKRLDERSEIPKKVTQKIDIEKNAAIEIEEKNLEINRLSALEEENKRHDQKIAEIEKEYATNRLIRLEAIKTEYEEKCNTLISQEYKKQTEQLEKILQGKKEELALRQKVLNDGLKNNFAKVLETFNADHDEVIKNIDQQKKSSELIDLTKYMSQAN
ncbi:hypothetical protein SSM_02803 [Enterococcus faecium EnGen0192]|uniref:Uncharacterized protein n=1 Tax=Enterococcus faecium EnGen0192 TaxID=1157487 RepID=A0A829FBD8_ENTFC|nr:hypothetical protein [Enterococcus faecium]EJC3722559.1 hypothetical protein [Enterococcus faecium]EOM07865.1 hypothetical protein U9W_02992 [Enterococcus faecium EnGen0261]EOM19201.1 hypothetical protein SSM_02803 [Enterococcus faecium EnGen0192]MCU1986392.1 hypothetical protein [Enterococcus faecium]RCN87973.1 hypothetical protein B1178_11855 [Enterococcus faecium]